MEQTLGKEMAVPGRSASAVMADWLRTPSDPTGTTSLGKQFLMGFIFLRLMGKEMKQVLSDERQIQASC